jgi:hypothetical protein
MDDVLNLVIMDDHILSQKVIRSEQLLGMVSDFFLSKFTLFIDNVWIAYPTWLSLLGDKVKYLRSIPYHKSIN